MDDSTPNDTIPSLDHAGVGESGPTTTLPACPVERLARATWQPRKLFDEAKLAQLAADIAVRGVLQALVVREVPYLPAGHFEIVCGERRWRAAQRAGLAAVPVVVRVLDDREALECSLSENGPRDALHPLEEADGFLALHTQYGESVEDIAARFGVSTKLVHQRLSLAKLCDEARAAFLEGWLSWGTALRVARLASLDHQRETVKFLEERAKSYGQPVSSGEAARWIDGRFHLRLADAPFDTKSPDVLPGAGPCTTCPRNSDAQVPMFGDDVTPGQCMDPACFARKKEAAWQAVAAPVAQGRRVLTAEQSAEAAPCYAGGSWNGGYASPGEKPYELGGKKTLRQLLGANMPETVIARDREGKPVEVIPPDALKEAMKKAGLGKEKKGGSSSALQWKSPKDYRAEAEAEEKVQRATAQACRDALAKRTLQDGDRGLWQFLALVVSLVFEDSADLVLQRRNGGKPMVPKGGDIFHPHREETAALSPSGCRAYIFDVLFEDLSEGFNADVGKAVCAFLKVDAGAVEKKVKADLEAKKKPAPEVAKPSGKKTTKAAPKKAPAKPAAKKGGRK